MKKYSKKIVCIFVVALMIFSLTACVPNIQGNDNIEGDNDPFGKFNEMVTLKMVTTQDATVTSQVLPFTPGESIRDNRFTRLFKDKLNIDIKYEWIANDAEDYKTKLDAMQTVGKLPDTLITDPAGIQDFVDAGLVQDMTQYWEIYASPLLKEITQADGKGPFQAVTHDGKLYAIPQIYSSIDRAQFVWVRVDWIEKLNKEKGMNLSTHPSTLSDLLDIISAFSANATFLGNSNGYGLSLQGDIWSEMGNIKPIMNMLDAYPTIWTENSAGKAVYGSIQSQVKDALKVLNTMYKNKEINQAFTTATEDTVATDVTSGRSGVVFGEQWLCDYPLNNTTGSKANWQSFTLMDNKSTQISMGTYGYWAVFNTCQRPEAIIKLLNCYVENIWGSKADFNTYYMPADSGAAVWKLSPVKPEPPTKNLDAYLAIKNAKNNNQLDSLVGEPLSIYKNIQLYLNQSGAGWT
ncbi:MAG: extracellular solute-binding protein, partial [Clostridia bacterium]